MADENKNNTNEGEKSESLPNTIKKILDWGSASTLLGAALIVRYLAGIHDSISLDWSSLGSLLVIPTFVGIMVIFSIRGINLANFFAFGLVTQISSPEISI